MKDNGYGTASLYDGGWRSEDKEELKVQYGLTDEEADEICEELKLYEGNN